MWAALSCSFDSSCSKIVEERGFPIEVINFLSSEDKELKEQAVTFLVNVCIEPTKNWEYLMQNENSVNVTLGKFIFYFIIIFIFIFIFIFFSLFLFFFIFFFIIFIFFYFFFKKKIHFYFIFKTYKVFFLLETKKLIYWQVNK